MRQRMRGALTAVEQTRVDARILMERHGVNEQREQAETTAADKKADDK